MTSPRGTRDLAGRARLAVLVLGGLAVLAGCTGAEEGAERSLLLVTIDTLRADHVSAYGYARATTPTLDALAADGVRFTTMIAPLPETGPSCATLLTGRWPAELTMRGNGDRLPDRFATLAERLADRGYRTGGFVSGYPLIARLSGLERGFDVYDDAMPDARGRVAGVQRLAEKTVTRALSWLDRDDSRPFFLWVHLYDVHGDYDPGKPYENLFADDAPGRRIPLSAIPEYQRLGTSTDTSLYIRRYDGEIRRVDDQIRRVIDRLDRSGRRDDTVIAISSDHGESLTEHGYFFDHGNELYMPSAHVPFILNGPGIPADGHVVPNVVRSVDIVPTIFELLGAEPPVGLPGVSLVPTWTPGRTFPEVEGFSEARFKAYPALTAGADVGPKLAARDDRFTAILRLTRGRLEVFDRRTDPGETVDLGPLLADLPGGPELLDGLEHALRDMLAEARAGAPVTTRAFPPERRQELVRLAATGAER